MYFELMDTMSAPEDLCTAGKVFGPAVWQSYLLFVFGNAGLSKIILHRRHKDSYCRAGAFQGLVCWRASQRF